MQSAMTRITPYKLFDGLNSATTLTSPYTNNVSFSRMNVRNFPWQQLVEAELEPHTKGVCPQSSHQTLRGHSIGYFGGTLDGKALILLITK